MRLAIYHDGRFIVTVPRRVPQTMIEKFLLEKAQWIIEKVTHYRTTGFVPKKKISKSDYLKYKNEARILIENRLAYFNQFYGYSWDKVSIKNQKTRWGSCSKKKNLSFNYKIALLPSDMADYIIVHELCHLAQFNHSKNFWDLVAKTIPDHKTLRKKLKTLQKEL